MLQLWKALGKVFVVRAKKTFAHVSSLPRRFSPSEMFTILVFIVEEKSEFHFCLEMKLNLLGQKVEAIVE